VGAAAVLICQPGCSRGNLTNMQADLLLRHLVAGLRECVDCFQGCICASDQVGHQRCLLVPSFCAAGGMPAVHAVLCVLNCWPIDAAALSTRSDSSWLTETIRSCSSGNSCLTNPGLQIQGSSGLATCQTAAGRPPRQQQQQALM
jgi:hypothetical protein